MVGKKFRRRKDGMKSIVIGLGETGQPLYEVLKEAYPETVGYDSKMGEYPDLDDIEIINICIPYSDKFISEVKGLQMWLCPSLTIIHSTVPIGTTAQIPNAVHSPILGKHNNMKQSIKSFVKWVGGEMADEAGEYLRGAGLKCRIVPTSQETEMLKLLCLAKYGKDIAFAEYADDLCREYGVSYDHVIEWDINYNSHVGDYRRPIILPPKGKIGGHCVVQNTKILNEQHPNTMLDEILKYDGQEKQYKAWGHCNIYPSARIGKGVNIGTFSEIGANVFIGENTRIGAMSYIPEGVVIGSDCFIGPRCTFTNDKYPPSHREEWLPTIIENGARIGAGVTVICGVMIGKGALIGAGSVVTKSVPAGEKWAGVPARKMEDKKEAVCQ